MIFSSEDDKTRYTKAWEEIKKVINKVVNNKISEFSKDYSVIMFESESSLPLNSTIIIRSLTIIIRSVLVSNNCFYPQIYLNNCRYEV